MSGGLFWNISGYLKNHSRIEESNKLPDWFWGIKTNINTLNSRILRGVKIVKE